MIYFGTRLSGNISRREPESYLFYRDMMILKGVSTKQIKPVREIDTPMKENFFFHLVEKQTE